jgi:hypothetical protein
VVKAHHLFLLIYKEAFEALHIPSHNTRQHLHESRHICLHLSLSLASPYTELQRNDMIHRLIVEVARYFPLG